MSHIAPLSEHHRSASPDPTFTPVEAARLCGVSLDTIRRRIRSGKIPGAVRRGEAPFGEWMLPRSGLEAASLLDDALPERIPVVGAVEAELAELRAELARWQERAEAAERFVESLRSEIEFNRRVVEQLAAPQRMEA